MGNEAKKHSGNICLRLVFTLSCKRVVKCAARPQGDHPVPQVYVHARVKYSGPLLVLERREKSARTQ